MIEEDSVRVVILDHWRTRAMTATAKTVPARVSSTSDPTNNVQRFHAALQLLQSHVPTMSVSQAMSFVTVAMNPGHNLRELAQITHAPQSTMSRHMLDLSTYARSRTGMEDGKYTKKAGWGLIEVAQSPTSMRDKVYTLSPKGKALVNLLGTILAVGPKGIDLSTRS